MLRFDVYRDGVPAETINLSGAYLFGQEAIPVKAEIAADQGQITCLKRAPGACGLTLLWPSRNQGELMLSTTRLPERKEPYNLNLELARARMMMLTQKREDWGLIDYQNTEQLGEAYDRVRGLFIEALKLNPDDPAEAAAIADDCLDQAIALSDEHVTFHANIFLTRRRTSSTSRCGFGCQVDLFSLNDAYLTRLGEAVDFIQVPLPWKHIEPKEHQTQYAQLDAWTEWCIKQRLPVFAGPLVNFAPNVNPEWLYIWEHDYETLREMIYEYVQRVVTRYSKRVHYWQVVSGLHAHNSFNLNFEQLMELTRMSCSLVKKLAPKSHVIVDLVMPWGEYYARNQRTIPPMMYADMCVQSGVKFDAFGVQVYFGAAEDGFYVRDLIQVSDMLDEFVTLGKTVHLTACQAPSDTKADKWDAWHGQAHPERAGSWRGPWTPQRQADWFEAVSQIALSKPYIDTVCWRDLADYEGHFLPHGGLCGCDLSPKPAYQTLLKMRSEFSNRARKPGKAKPPTPNAIQPPPEGEPN